MNISGILYFAILAPLILPQILEITIIILRWTNNARRRKTQQNYDALSLEKKLPSLNKNEVL